MEIKPATTEKILLIDHNQGIELSTFDTALIPEGIIIPIKIPDNAVISVIITTRIKKEYTIIDSPTYLMKR